MTQPHQIDRACQKCGGEIQGWTCQGCGQVFRENDAGSLVFDAMEAVAWRENLADFARYVSGQMHNLPRSATADNVNDRALAILQALAVIPTEGGGGRETKGPGT